jgi:hypothetical protein
LSEIQATLVIRGLGIRGFAYQRFSFCVQNPLSADFSLDYPRIWLPKWLKSKDFAHS